MTEFATIPPRVKAWQEGETWKGEKVWHARVGYNSYHGSWEYALDAIRRHVAQREKAFKTLQERGKTF